MARADRRRSVREARRIERRPRAAGGGQHVLGRHESSRSCARSQVGVHPSGGGVRDSFVFLGVGSGSSGLGDLLNGNFDNLFSSNSGTSAQVEKTRADRQNPKDYAAYKDIASAQASDDKVDAAIATLVKLKAVARRRRRAHAAREPLPAEGRQRTPRGRHRAGRGAGHGRPDGIRAGRDDSVRQGLQELLGAAFDCDLDRLEHEVQRRVHEDDRRLLPGGRRAPGRREGDPERPEHPVRSRETAEQATDTKSAIAAYKRFLKLAPEDPTAPAVRQRIKQLKQQAQLPTVSTG